MSDIADAALAITNLKARYCAAADLAAIDPDAARQRFADIFADDFAGDYGGVPLVGAAAITDFLCSAIPANSIWMHHMLHTPLIEAGDATATGDWTVQAQMKRRSNGAVDSVIGRYSDEFRRTASGWRIAKVTFTRPE